MLDLTKPVTTRDGREFRLYATDGAAPYVLHGAYKTEDGWEDGNWCKDGSYIERCTDHAAAWNLGLINPPDRFRFERWAVVERTTYGLKQFAITHICDFEPTTPPPGQTIVKFIIEGAEGDGL